MAAGSASFDCGTDGNRRGKYRIREECRAAEHGGNREPCAVLANQRVQCEDAAFAIVVDAHGDEHIFDGSDQRNRPEDQRQHAEHGLSVYAAKPSLTGKEGLRGVQGRGADVAVHHAERHDCHAPGDLVWAGLQAGPPSTEAAFRPCAGDFLGFFGFSFPLLGECLALLLGESGGGHLGALVKVSASAVLLLPVGPWLWRHQTGLSGPLRLFGTCVLWFDSAIRSVLH